MCHDDCEYFRIEIVKIKGNVEKKLGLSSEVSTFSELSLAAGMKIGRFETEGTWRNGKCVRLGSLSFFNLQMRFRNTSSAFAITQNRRHFLVSADVCFRLS
jgi:hypothetical protein